MHNDSLMWMIFGILVFGMLYGVGSTLIHHLRARPRPQGNGFEVLDAEDAGQERSTGLFLMLVAFPFMVLSVLIFFEGQEAHAPLMAIVIFGISALLMMLALGLLRHQSREKKKAKPGRLWVSQTPVVPGDSATLRFRRLLNEEFTPATVRGRLNFEAGRSSHNRVVWSTLWQTDLPVSALEIQNQEASTTWELEIPDPAPPESSNLSGGRNAPHLCRWVVRVTLKTTGEEVLDSCFHLPFAYPVRTFSAKPF